MSDENTKATETTDSAASALSAGLGSVVDAGDVVPSSARYVVTYAHRHKTLVVGDVVVMTETPSMDNLLLREADMTLHKLLDSSQQYVHLAKAPNVEFSGTPAALSPEAPLERRVGHGGNDGE
jgi:hypothetical protein